MDGNQFSVHSNLRITFGPLRWVLATPEFHHWHHAKDLEARDKNFAGQLPILDVLFGTLYMPHKTRPKAYGIDEPMPANYIAQLAHPWRTRRPWLFQRMAMRRKQRRIPSKAIRRLAGASVR